MNRTLWVALENCYRRGSSRALYVFTSAHCRESDYHVTAIYTHRAAERAAVGAASTALPIVACVSSLSWKQPDDWCALCRIYSSSTVLCVSSFWIEIFFCWINFENRGRLSELRVLLEVDDFSRGSNYRREIVFPRNDNNNFDRFLYNVESNWKLYIFNEISI